MTIMVWPGDWCLSAHSGLPPPGGGRVCIGRVFQGEAVCRAGQNLNDLVRSSVFPADLGNFAKTVRSLATTLRAIRRDVRRVVYRFAAWAEVEIKGVMVRVQRVMFEFPSQ